MKLTGLFFFLLIIFGFQSTSHIDAGVFKELGQSQSLANENIHTYYVKYGDVPQYDTIWCMVVFDYTKIGINIDLRARADQKGVLHMLKRSVTIGWDHNPRAVEINQEEYEQAANRLKVEYVMTTMSTQLQTAGTDGKPDKWWVRMAYNNNYSLKLADIDTVAQGSGTGFSAAAASSRTGGVGTNDHATWNRLGTYFTAQLVYLLPIECHVAGIQSPKAGQLQVDIDQIPYGLENVNVRETYLFERKDFQYSGYNADVNKALGGTDFTIVSDQKAKANFIKIGKKEYANLSPFLGREAELMVVIQGKSSP